MTHRDWQDHWRGLRLPVPGRRTRVVVALIGFLLSLGVPIVVLSTPGLTVDGRLAARRLHNLTGVGVTGALPGDPLPSNTVLSGVPGGSVGAGPSETAVPRAVPAGVSADPVAAGPPGTPVPRAVSADSVGAGPLRVAVRQNLPEGPLGIPGVMLDAYQRAARTLAATQPGCHLSWSVLAGIGRIESGHASDGRIDAAGNTLGPILGPRLDGSAGMAAIPDTDHGLLDGDPVWDRAVGPMQFIPSSWRSWGVGSPNNIYDSTLAAGRYLCAGGADLSDPAQLQMAVYRYNHSATYVDVVLRWAAAYLTGLIPTPSAPGPVPPGTNGNGGRPIVTDPAPPVSVALAGVAQPAPRAATPPMTTTSSSPPATPMTPPPTTTTSPSPPPSVTTTTPVEPPSLSPSATAPPPTSPPPARP
ncbi:MAG: lytic transglycosylase [Pseudonocardiaceae bacterium]